MFEMLKKAESWRGKILSQEYMKHIQTITFNNLIETITGYIIKLVPLGHIQNA